MNSLGWWSLGISAIALTLGLLVWLAKREGSAKALQGVAEGEVDAAKRVADAESRQITDSDELLGELRDGRRKL